MNTLAESFDNLKISAFAKTRLIENQHKAALQYLEQNEQNHRADENSNRSGKLSPLRTSPRNSPYTYNKSAYKKNLMEFEMQLNHQVQQRLNTRIKQIVKFERQLQLESKENWLLQQKRLIEKMEQAENSIRQSIEQHNLETTNKHQKLDNYYRELAETQQKVFQEMQQERKKQYLMAIFDNIKRNQLEFRDVYQETINLIKMCKNDASSSQNPCACIVSDLRALVPAMDEVVASCRSGNVSDVEVKKSEDLVNSLKAVRDKTVEIVNYSRAKLQQTDTVDSSTQGSSEQNISHQQQAVEPVEIDEQNKTVLDSSSKQNSSSLLFDTKKYVSKINFKIYSDYQQFLQSYQENYKALLADVNCKKFRIDCMKAVNMPVNAISDSNAQHLQSKYLHLKNLLAGQTVQIGDQQINASRHPQGIFYCTDLLAAKFVKQADNLVSNNQTQPFCYAAIITALWNDYPDFGKLIMAHFHKQCPYLVPFYMPRGAEESDSEYYSSRGYTYDSNGAVEKQDKFLRRMTGMVRLYSAILISKPKKNQGKPNPHGISHAWTWLASILNLEPEFDITATVLHEFLVTVSTTMQVIYGRMFTKLMHFLISVYLPRMRKIDTGAPSSRLSTLLESYVKEGRFQDPPGILPGNFW